jgi:small GTP-binding protein
VKNSLFKKFISSAMAAFVLFPPPNRVNAEDPPVKLNTYVVKAVLVGNSGVGKTATAGSIYFEKVYTSGFEKTAGVEYYPVCVGKGNDRVKVQMWDTSGRKEFKSITFAYLRGCMAIVIFTDLLKENVEATSEWLRGCKEHELPSDAKVLFVINENTPSPCAPNDRFDSAEAAEARLKELHENEILGKPDICCVNPSKPEGCNELLRRLENLASDCLREGKYYRYPFSINLLAHRKSHTLLAQGRF